MENNQETPIEEKTEETPEVIPESVRDFLGEEDTKELEKETKEETEEEPEEEPKEEKEPEVPLEEIVEEVKTKTKDEIKADIMKALGMTEEEKVVAEEAGYKTPWEKRGEEAPKDWREVMEAGIEFQEFKKTEQDKILSETQKQELATAKAREAAINTEWDSQLEYLRAEKLIPQIDPKVKQKLSEGKNLTVQEREDPGLKAQVGIFETMYTLAQEAELQGKEPPTTDVIHTFHRYYKPKVRPSGMDAPVSGGGVPIAKAEEEEIPYDKIHEARSFEELLQ